jgi:glycyl-tRNA synthetase beta chain
MDRKDFLFEIGVEELPASYIALAIDYLVKYFEENLRGRNLHFEHISYYSTPRRLALIIHELVIKQNDEVVEKVGPAKSVAFNSDGTLTKAGEGFIRGANCEAKDSFIIETPKGEYIAVKKEVKGELSSVILKDIGATAIKKIQFPKAMYWKAKTEKFARPIRWITALFGEDVINIECNGLKAGRVTYGNVFSKKGVEISIDRPLNYPILLEKEGMVIADRDKRKSVIFNQINKLASGRNSKVIEPEDLLEEVTDIVEYPTAVLARYNESYLSLPNKLIEATLVKNQKYFPLYKADGEMENHFIFVANNLPEYAENTRAGNERVVKARLDDAEFYYKEDGAKNISYFNDKLSEVIFAASLGTVYEKTRRIAKLTEYLSEELKLSSEEKNDSMRLADICKFDLSTLMVGEKEFATLQGYVGRNYAQLWGEKESVAIGIEEHYFPLGPTHDLPSNRCATVVSIADKIDTLAAVFGIGIIPTGSNDPYALRRAANGMVRILFEKELRIDLEKLIAHTYDLLQDKLKPDNNGKVNLLNYFRQRIEWYMQQHGFSQDICKAVLATSDYDFVKIKAKVITLDKVKNSEDFKSLAISFKRVSNIISKETEYKTLREDLLVEKEEQELNRAVAQKEVIINDLSEQEGYQGIVHHLINLKTEIDNFFDKVMVNVESKEVRDNRYALLKRVRELFLAVADLSFIVVDNEK